MPSQAEQEMVLDGGIKSGDLRGYIQRIENLDTEIEGLREDIKAIKSDAKAKGFNVKIINQILKIRKRDANELEEEEILLDLYKRALGME